MLDKLCHRYLIHTLIQGYWGWGYIFLDTGLGLTCDTLMLGLLMHVLYLIWVVDKYMLGNQGVTKNKT